MKSRQYLYWFFCLGCTAVCGALLIFMLWPTVYYIYTEAGFWFLMSLVCFPVIAFCGSYPIAFWHDRPWKKKDRQS